MEGATFSAAHELTVTSEDQERYKQALKEQFAQHDREVQARLKRLAAERKSREAESQRRPDEDDELESFKAD